MATIVVNIKDKEQINEFRNKYHIPDDIAIITLSEYESDKEKYQKSETEIIDTFFPFRKLPEIELLPAPSEIEITQGRTYKQKKEQDKWRKRYGYKK